MVIGAQIYVYIFKLCPWGCPVHLPGCW